VATRTGQGVTWSDKRISQRTSHHYTFSSRGDSNLGSAEYKLCNNLQCLCMKYVRQAHSMSRVFITNRIPVGKCMHSGSVWIILKLRNFLNTFWWRQSKCWPLLYEPYSEVARALRHTETLVSINYE
jgi:hypothetical protein